MRFFKFLRKTKSVAKRAPQKRQTQKRPEEYRGYSVYAITSDNSRCAYIGMTGSFERRKGQHFDPIYRGKEKHKYLYQVMAKKGADAFHMVQLFAGLSENEAKYLEARMIRDWATVKPYGYNVAEEEDSRMLGYDIATKSPQLFYATKKYMSVRSKHALAEMSPANLKKFEPVRCLKGHINIPQCWRDLE